MTTRMTSPLPDTMTKTDSAYLDAADLRQALKTAHRILTNEQKNTVIRDSVTGARVTLGELIDAAFENDQPTFTTPAE